MSHDFKLFILSLLLQSLECSDNCKPETHNGSNVAEKRKGKTGTAKKGDEHLIIFES